MAAFIALGWEIWRYYADAPKVEWDVHVPITPATMTDSTTEWYTLRATNTGDASAIQLQVWGSPGVVVSPLPTRLDPGADLGISVEIPNPQKIEDTPKVYVEYLTTPVRRRQRRTLVIDLKSRHQSVRKESRRGRAKD